MAQLTAQQLLNFLNDLKDKGHNLKKIKVKHRKNMDSDTHKVNSVFEDLYLEDNSTLESIVLINK